MKRSLCVFLIISNSISLASAPAAAAAGSAAKANPPVGIKAQAFAGKRGSLAKPKQSAGSLGKASAALPVVNTAAASTASAGAKESGEGAQAMSAEDKEFRDRLLLLEDSFGEDCAGMPEQVLRDHASCNNQSPEGSAANEVHEITQKFGFALSAALARSSGYQANTEAQMIILKRYLFGTIIQSQTQEVELKKLKLEQERQKKELEELRAQLKVDKKPDQKRRNSQ